MDFELALQEGQETYAPISSEGIDKWNAHKDQIYTIYIQQNNTLERTMQMIENQGGPKARWVT